jgi:hypothetical protein
MLLNGKRFKIMRKIFSLLIAVLITTNSFLAQTAKEMPSFKPEIKRIAVFKNGYAFTYREGEATTLNGWAYTTNLPIGVMGTVWGYSGTPNTKVQQLLASETARPDTETIMRVGDLFDLLKSNEGARIHIDAYDNKTFEGAYSLIGNDANNYSIALQTERGTMVIAPGRIQTVEIIGKPNFDKKVVVKNAPENRLAIRTDGAKDGEPINLGIAALERGIRWIPAYRVEVKGEPIKEAKLELEAVLVNELADLKGSEVYFVVGVPSFAFKDMLSPLSMNQAFAGVSGYFQNGQKDFASNAIMTQQTRMGETADESGIGPSPTTPEDEQTTSLSAEQLYLYKTDQLDLKKGERASLRLFSLTIPATEVFEWTVMDPPRASGDEYSLRPSLGQDLSSGVWYSLRLKNETGMPLTTAPAVTFREWKPLGQNLIRFTPTGGDTILRVSPATEVIGTHTLEEKTRETVNLRMSGSNYSFDLITVEGTMKIRNVKKQPVEMVITRNINGEVISATDGGTIKREGFNLASINPNSVVKWNVSVPPGEKEIKYTYKVYVRK